MQINAARDHAGGGDLRGATSSQNAREMMETGPEWWFATTAPLISHGPWVPFSDQLAAVVDLVDQSLEFAGRILAIQRSFAKRVLAPLEGAKHEPAEVEAGASSV